jgi:inner membrane protein
VKWFNHLLIAGATCAVVAPQLVPVALLGSTAPDWMEWVSGALGRKVKHRTVTHVMTYWIAAMLFCGLLWDFHGIGLAFAYGGFTHVLADSLTIMGVPLLPGSDRRTNLFGGRLRTGEMGEFVVAGGIAAACFFMAGNLHTSENFFPFFYGWGDLYKSGVIDAYEWKQNRLNFI